MKKLLGLFISIGLLVVMTSCGTKQSSSDSGEISSPLPDKLNLGLLDASEFLSRNYAYDYENEIPDFPLSVKDYVLQKQSKQDNLRLFEGDDWKVPILEFNPEMGGGASMSCQPFYWILRWRSDNSDVSILASTGMTDGPYDPFDEIVTGGVGISEGFSCAVPALKFDKALNGSEGNLVDVNFEYQIWEYKPKI